MKVLIVDDEAPARARLAQLVNDLPELEVAGEAANGRDALEANERLAPDVVLLDIRMPGMDGLEAARHLATLERPPAVIFITAYEEHALEAFGAQAVDYLLKPVRRERLEQALAKATRLSRAQLDAMAEARPEPSARTHLSVTLHGRLQLIPVNEVIFFRAEQKYVTVRHTGGETLVEDSLKSLEQEFGGRFVRIHRNTLVARAALEGMEKNRDGSHYVKLRGCEERPEISRRHVAEIRRLLKSGRLTG